MQKSGKLVIGSSEGYGEYDPWADKLIFASDVPLDPVTVVHEWRHHIQRKRLGFFVYKLVAVPNLIQGAIRGTQAGYMDDIAERDANHIVHDCKVR